MAGRAHLPSFRCYRKGSGHMSFVSRMIGTAECVPLPDLVIRGAVRRMCSLTAKRLASGSAEWCRCSLSPCRGFLRASGSRPKRRQQQKRTGRRSLSRIVIAGVRGDASLRDCISNLHAWLIRINAKGARPSLDNSLGGHLKTPVSDRVPDLNVATVCKANSEDEKAMGLVDAQAYIDRTNDEHRHYGCRWQSWRL